MSNITSSDSRRAGHRTSLPLVVTTTSVSFCRNRLLPHWRSRRHTSLLGGTRLSSEAHVSPRRHTSLLGGTRLSSEAHVSPRRHTSLLGASRTNLLLRDWYRFIHESWFQPVDGDRQCRRRSRMW